MTRDKRHVTEAELAVLETLWEEEPTTIRQITDRLYPDGRASHYATVQKLLERLEAKSYVKRQRTRVPHRFRARIDRGSLIAHRLREVADALCGGSLAPLFTQLVESKQLGDEDVRALRALVEELDEGGKP